jgi:hypothetical protein
MSNEVKKTIICINTLKISNETVVNGVDVRKSCALPREEEDVDDEDILLVINTGECIVYPNGRMKYDKLFSCHPHHPHRQ